MIVNRVEVSAVDIKGGDLLGCEDDRGPGRM
jgi:hypothetical protein